MEKIILVAKKSVSTSRKRFLLKRLLPPNFKIFNRALNKTILFLLDRKKFSASRNEEFVKKTFPLGETVFTALNILASENHFLSLSQSQTTVNCCQWKQFILQLEHIFQSFLYSGQLKRVFCLLETLFYSEFFLLVETIIETWGKSIFKDEIYSCQ